MFWEHREDTELVPLQCDVSQSRKPLIFQEPLCKGSKQNTENTVMTDPSGVNGLSNFFFFQNSWKKEFWNDPQSWKHVENWYTFHSMSAKCCVCTGRGNPATITCISQLLSGNSTALTWGAEELLPLFYIGATSIFIWLKKKKKSEYMLYLHTHVIFKKWKAHSTVFWYNININSNTQIPGGNVIIYEP